MSLVVFDSHAPTAPAVTKAERCARSTLAAAQRLLYPESNLSPMSQVELELARYVKETYRPRFTSRSYPETAG
ncbi:Uncharacterised protein [Achromobacter xylosoxidans]|nr:Uncharacterised protein [Achromobacter xylosoxidans]CUJ48835.1 Uncharacterised protein [Achromobacter xylosoxidans]CUJ54719.1 Uncharacterised protein [Achromobacter xylosoxidans]CUR74597.1 hypothetical protein BN2905_35460 [Achromobacter xylosoxidans]SQG71591.1 Uncharacterised protein [Achromobacter xylosoxidans]